jgi:hypothetical protein
MFCPFKMANPELASNWDTAAAMYSSQNWDCEKEKCAWWNERFGICSLTVDGYLKAIEDSRKEAKEFMQDQRGY